MECYKSKFSVAGFGFSDPTALVFLSLGTGHLLLTWDAPTPHQRSQQELKDTFRATERLGVF